MMESSVMEGEEYYNPEGSEWSQKVDTGQLCRVCANANDYLIPIFDGEGLEHELGMKIEKHLPIKVMWMYCFAGEKHKYMFSFCIMIGNGYLHTKICVGVWACKFSLKQQITSWDCSGIGFCVGVVLLAGILISIGSTISQKLLRSEGIGLWSVLIWHLMAHYRIILCLVLILILFHSQLCHNEKTLKIESVTIC